MGKIGSIGCFALMGAATVLMTAFLVIWVRGSKKHEYMVQALDEKKYPVRELYTFGLEVLSLAKYSYHSRFDRMMRGYCRIIHGERYADFYYRIYLAQIITIPFLVLAGVCVVSALINNLLVMLFGLLAVFGIAYYYHSLVTDIIKEREESITRDFPETLSKLALLVNAGMIMKEAWEKTADTGSGVLYREMKTAIADINNGEAEVEAYLDFARRCGLNEVNKFASTLVQNLSKGNREIVEFLKLYSAESWEMRKHLAKRKGEEASSKLLLPVGLMFLGLLIMIAVPIMTNISI